MPAARQPSRSPVMAQSCSIRSGAEGEALHRPVPVTAIDAAPLLIHEPIRLQPPHGGLGSVRRDARISVRRYTERRGGTRGVGDVDVRGGDRLDLAAEGGAALGGEGEAAGHRSGAGNGPVAMGSGGLASARRYWTRRLQRCERLTPLRL